MSTPALLRPAPELRTLGARLADHQLATAASAMAFDLFLALVPVLALVGWALGALGRAGQLVPLEEAIAHAAPGPAAAVAKEQLHRLGRAGEGLAPLAVLGFVWVATGGAHTALATLRVVAGVRRWGWIHTRLVALAFVLVGLAIVGGSSTLMVMIERAARANLLGRGGANFGHACNAVATFLASALGVAVFYRLAQDRDLHRRRVWPGAVLAVAIFAAASLGFSLYAATLGRYAAFYGGLAAVAMLLVWLWLSSFALLVGAEINAMLDAWIARAALGSAPPDPRPAPVRDAIITQRR